MTARPHACFGMYPFAPVRPAWEALVAALHDHLDWVPVGLDWSEDVHDSWADPSCVMSHACGWPLAALHADELQVVGAFAPAIAGADGHRYRSVLLATRPGDPADFARPDVRAVANSRDSLSGWVSLVAGVVGPGGRWPGSALWSGAHAESLRALREGRADIAAIDAWSLAHFRRMDPEATEGLHEIGLGPWIPSPAVVLRADEPRERVATARAAFADLVHDPALAPALEALMIGGFVPLDLDDYRAVLTLTPAS